MEDSGGRRSSRTSSAKSSDAIPRNVPEGDMVVSAAREEWSVGSHAVVGRQLVGHVDNSSYPAITVDIQMTLVTPAEATRPVPVMIMFGSGLLPSAAGGAGRARRGRLPPPGERSATRGAADRRRLGLRVPEPDEHSGRQRRRLDERHHRPRQQGPAAKARRLGFAARLGVGRVARARLLRNVEDGRRQARRHRRRFALRQGGARHDGLRPALRRRPRRLVRRGGRQAASPQLRRGSREPHRLGRIPLDGRQLPEVRRRGRDLRLEERRGLPGRRAPADRAVRSAPDVHQLRRSRRKATPSGSISKGSFMAAIAAQPVFRLLGAKDLGRSDDYRPRRCPPSTRACSTGSWRGGSTTAATPTAPTGSTSSRGPTGCSVERTNGVALDTRTRSCLINLTLVPRCERASRASHASGARRRSGARERV